MNYMGFSIQDYLKKINSRLTVIDCVSVLFTTLILVLFYGFIHNRYTSSRIPVSYFEQEIDTTIIEKAESRPFASSKGTTYTFSWCQGANRISAKNKVFFANEDEAKRSGRVLSKLCQK
jgi:hypothetical protein